MILKCLLHVSQMFFAMNMCVLCDYSLCITLCSESIIKALSFYDFTIEEHFLEYVDPGITDMYLS